MFRFPQKLKHIKNKVKIWNKESFGNTFQEKKRVELQLIDLQQYSMIEWFSDTFKKEEENLLKELETREIWEKTF